MTTAEISGEVAFKGLDFGAEDIAAVAQHAQGGLADSVVDLWAETAQVKERNGHRRILRVT
jgi:hypothetical protein